MSSIEKEGWLTKLAPDHHGILNSIYSSKKRLCRLYSDGNLKYFENGSSNIEKGTIKMKNVVRVEEEATNKHNHLVVLYPKEKGARVFKLNAKNEKEQDEWCKALSHFLATELSDDEHEFNDENGNNNNKQTVGEKKKQDGCECVQETESHDRRESDATSGYGSTNTVNGSKASLAGTKEDPDHAHMVIKCPNCSTQIPLDCKVTEPVERRRRQPEENTERPKSECLHSKTRHKIPVENGLSDITEDEEGGKEGRCKTVPKGYKATFKKGSEEVKFNNDP